ncbi:unnamed protein product [Sordaria macrospora k-hell]|uniref:WGS project CABT00000000 data, contig 2.7 n=1 Tax=Sordaria macrospora (strain ATCC MYA-333 / DSM 997 / K(L3346) / K-hell) TaxID=771870 RepID=F7VTN6_SORMK|nr:uncharacterized protein SMAC_07511 [Sordaria macrospora k-hell]KAH7632632.1 hypothetical protein B0T09DRAFT_380156 [Sordaria sp. MPI-SDFR-AT-0083]CCC08874.1 unnamed protein product [Sordaria macrospora k-hell]
MSTPSDSYVLHDHSPSTDNDDDVASLPSISSSILDSDDDSEYDDESDAQKEWEQSLEQLQLLMTMVLIPFAGKFLGRKFAYWSWGRYMEWMHGVKVEWYNKTLFNIAGWVGAASTV